MEKEITKYIYFSFENTPPELANTRSLEFSNHKIIEYLNHVFVQPLEHTPNHINPNNFEKIRAVETYLNTRPTLSGIGIEPLLELNGVPTSTSFGRD